MHVLVVLPHDLGNSSRSVLLITREISLLCPLIPLYTMVYPDDGWPEFTSLMSTVGVIPGSITPTTRHNAAKNLKELLLKHGITDRVDIEFAEYVFCNRKEVQFESSTT